MMVLDEKRLTYLKYSVNAQWKGILLLKFVWKNKELQTLVCVQTRVVAARAVDDQQPGTTINNFKINKEEERSFSWFMSISGAHWDQLKKTGASRPNHKNKPFKAFKNTSCNRLKKKKRLPDFCFCLLFGQKGLGVKGLCCPLRHCCIIY